MRLCCTTVEICVTGAIPTTNHTGRITHQDETTWHHDWDNGAGADPCTCLSDGVSHLEEFSVVKSGAWKLENASNNLLLVTEE